MIAWLSACCYLGSRCAQLRRNWAAARGAAAGGAAAAGAEGLSQAMFLTAVLANTLYGTSVLLRAAIKPPDKRAASLRDAAPWLAGSLGCCALDVIICSQAVASARRARAAAAAAGAAVAEEGAYERLAEAAA